jgi:hypothetical protein
MENKQTAVELLASLMISSSTLPFKTIDEYIEQAKAMEKEQHFKTWETGSYSLLDCSNGKDFEQYYNETYGK